MCELLECTDGDFFSSKIVGRGDKTLLKAMMRSKYHNEFAKREYFAEVSYLADDRAEVSDVYGNGKRWMIL